MFARLLSDGSTVADTRHDLRSKVNALSAMVDMIAIARAYAALEQADGMLDHIDGLVKDLGKPA